MDTGQRRGTRVASSQSARQVNLRSVLRTLAAGEADSRASLARVTGMARPTVTRLVAELLDSGLVAEVGTGSSDGGKPPRLLAVNRSARQVVAIDLSRRPLVATLADLAGTESARHTVGGAHTAGDRLVAAVVDVVSDLAPRATAPVAGVGVATPGLVTRDGVVVEAANLGWHDLRLASILQERTGLPAWVGNDADAAALVEYGTRAGASDGLAVVRIGRGVGAGLVLAGRLHAGARAAAGEIGHLVVEPGGHPCSCGNRGCLETVISVPSIVGQAAAAAGADPAGLPWDATALRHRLGDEAVHAALQAAGTRLGAMLAHLVAIVDVTEIVLSLELEGVGEEFLETVRTTLVERLLPIDGEQIFVHLTDYGPDLILHGAHALVLAGAFGMARP